MIRAAGVLLMISASQVMANPLETQWCSDDQSMFIDSTGIGFNEHTICEVVNMPVQMNSNDRWSSAVACRNVYVTEFRDDGTHEFHEMPVEGLTQLNMVGAPDGTLILTTDLVEGEEHFLPCE